jgi:hypothetical protein
MQESQQFGFLFWAKKKGYDFHRNPLNFLVAGGGFEPPTFGL